MGGARTASGGTCFPRPFNSRTHQPTNPLTHSLTHFPYGGPAMSDTVHTSPPSVIT